MGTSVQRDKARVLLLAVVLSLGSCRTGVHKISERDVLTDNKLGSDRPVPKAGPLAPGPKPPAIYVKKSELIIKKRPHEEAVAGSLFQLADKRNHLFATYQPPDLGDYITINLVPNRQLPPGAEPGDDPGSDAKDAPLSPKDSTASANAKKSEADKAPANEEEAMLAALPEIAPPLGRGAPPLKQVRMKVVHRYPNGDVLAAYERRSKSEAEEHAFKLQARVPHQSLLDGAVVPTTELSDVKLTETRDGEIVERQSTSWEDEHSLRLSDYNEAKSRYAVALDDKKREIEEAKEKLATRLAAFGKERQKIAQDRDKLLGEKKADRNKIDELGQKLSEQETKIGEQTKQIEEQQKQIKELEKPQGKAGDAVDGAEGD